MNRTFGVVLAASLLAAASPAWAQGPKFSFNIGGGFVTPVSESKEVFGTGGNFELGGTFHASSAIGIQLQYGYNRFGSKDLTVTPTTPTPHAGDLNESIPLSVNHSQHNGELNLVFNPHTEHIAPYVIAGMGIYHDIVNVTTPSVGVATVCDPWIYVCYPGVVAVDQIIGERTNTAFGINVGGGLNFRAGHAAIYAEVRYIHDWGPSFTDATGASVSANGNYIPVTFGLRF